MQIHPNFKNCFFLFIVLFFTYLAYLLYFGNSSSYNALIDRHFLVDLKDVINYCVLAAEISGQAIVKIHEEKSSWKRVKSRDSLGADEFVTKADVVSHQLIMESLLRAPGLNVISEEKSHLPESQIEKYKSNNFLTWLRYRDLLKDLSMSPPSSSQYLLSDLTVWVDPLDATQEFTEDLLQYVTVMICVAVRGRPKFGVIHRPFYNETVYGLVGSGIYPAGYALINDVSAQPLALVSRSHAGQVKSIVTATLPDFQVEPAGGAGYKALRVLNGTARLYVHTTRIKKWDICAPHAIISAAGGKVTDLRGIDLSYNHKADKDADLSNDAELENGLLLTMADHFTYLSKLSRLLNDAERVTKSR